MTGHHSRRRFVQQLGAASVLALAPHATGNLSRPRPRVAAVFTEFRFRSHAYDILENFFSPYLFCGKLHDPGVDVVSFYADQFPQQDMARKAARDHNIPLFDSIDKALCQGGNRLDVDAVLLIGEHGDYPVNARGQKMYPRKQFFDQCVEVMQRSGRFVPLFNDKHLSYRWDWARQMYDVARANRMPLMAGSSVPLAQRVPMITLPHRAVVEEAVSIHGGALESYDFHGLELLQSMIESRRGGETGVSQVELLRGEKLQQALDSGRISRKLVKVAMQAEVEGDFKRQPWPGSDASSVAPPITPDRFFQVNHGLLLEYTDGTRASVLSIADSGNRWNFSCRVRGESTPLATSLYNGPWGNRCLFKALSHGIQQMFISGRPSYPVERTLMVSGILDAAMTSHQEGGQPVATPELEFAYRPTRLDRFRENGDSWKVITVDSPQPPLFEPGDARWLRASPG
jgi:hypothetical protein